MFDSNNVSVTQYRAEKVVNVEDVTGTGFIYTEPELWKLIQKQIRRVQDFFKNKNK